LSRLRDKGLTKYFLLTAQRHNVRLPSANVLNTTQAVSRSRGGYQMEST